MRPVAVQAWKPEFDHWILQWNNRTSSQKLSSGLLKHAVARAYPYWHLSLCLPLILSWFSLCLSPSPSLSLSDLQNKQAGNITQLHFHNVSRRAKSPETAGGCGGCGRLEFLPVGYGLYLRMMKQSGADENPPIAGTKCHRTICFHFVYMDLCDP